MPKLFTSESVTEGHPDKLCDQISDAILDAILAKDSAARVACEVTATTGLIHVMGEISTSCYVDIPEIARSTVEKVGYSTPAFGFCGKDCAVITSIDAQSPDISQGVTHSKEGKLDEADPLSILGAGDQGMMFGFACNETPEFMPLPISLAHKLAKQLADVRKKGTLDFLRPDGKTQVTVQYDENGRVDVDTIVISAQHNEGITEKNLRDAIIESVIRPVISSKFFDGINKILVNPTGKFVVGGPVGDSGLTGRKIIVDTYGGYARHGGGAFSGKDATKVDRSGAYAARHIAKNIVAANLAKKCEVQVAYAIGVANPVSIAVETFGTSSISSGKLALAIQKIFDLRPAAIIKNFALRRPIYQPLAAYGHMGREDLGVPWEKLDKVDALLEILK